MPDQLNDRCLGPSANRSSKVEPRQRIPGLDGLRAVAVLLVIGYHADGFIGNGFVGVDIFFVLSGFLITSLLLGEKERLGQISLGNFYARRALRLYPALVAMCVLVSLVAVLANRHSGAVLAGAVATLAYVANVWQYSPGHDTYLLQHTWTLSLEEQFYLVWPILLIVVLARKNAVWVVAGGLVAIAVTDEVLAHPPVLHTYIRAAGLPLGCAAAFFLRRARVCARLASLAWPAAIVILVLACVHFDLGSLLDGWPIGAVAVLSVPVLASLLGGGSLAAALSLPVLVWIGQRSYGLYIWHFPILTVFINQVPTSVPLTARLGAGVAISFVVAAASFRWVETPFLRQKRRFESA